MKFGQAMSIFEAGLPEEMAAPYRATLTKLQNAGAAHARQHRAQGPGRGARPAVALQLRRLRRPPRGGRVDRAGAQGGLARRPQVAVKVQYPGAGEALISDLDQVARAGRLGASWIPGLDINPILDELRSRMAEELDYTLGGGLAAGVRRGVRRRRGVRGPARSSPTARRSSSASGSTALAMSTVIASGTQEERDTVGPALRRAAAGRSACGPGLLHADPHPGNFMLMRRTGASGCWTSARSSTCPTACRPRSPSCSTRRCAGDGEGVVAGLRGGRVHQGRDRDRPGLAAGVPGAVPGPGPRGGVPVQPAAGCGTWSPTSTTRAVRPGRSG